MKIFTENETVDLSQQFIYRLRNLYLTDIELFNQVKDFIPHNYGVNHRHTLDIIEFDSKGFGSAPEIKMLFEEGATVLPEISSLELLNYATRKVNKFSSFNDNFGVCNYVQFIDLFGERRYLYSDKIILNSDYFFNLGILFNDMGSLGNKMLKIFPSIESSNEFWKKFQTLTKKEKKILKLLAEGYTIKEVGNILFISSHTAHVHKRNIYKKLDIHKINELIKVSTILELLEA